MKLENQVCLLNQAIRLKELGLTQETFLFYGDAELGVVSDEAYTIQEHPMLFRKNTGEFEITPVSEMPEWWDEDDYGVGETYAAFTVAELGVMLPDEYHSHSFQTTEGRRWVTYNDRGRNLTFRDGFYEREAEARAATLIYLLEHSKVTAEEVNQRLSNS